MYDRVSNFENSPSKAFTDCSSKKTNIRLEETPLSAVGSEMNFTNQYRMMGTSDTSFGEYQDYSPLTFRAYSPSPRRNRGSLIFSGSMPLAATAEEQMNQSYNYKTHVLTTR